MNYIKIKNQPDLVLDPRSGAVLNINKSKLQESLDQRKAILESRNNSEKVKSLEKDIKEVKDDLGAIKGLLEKLVKDKT